VKKAGTDPSTPPALKVSETKALLWAETSNTDQTEQVWAEIREPETPLETSGNNQQVVELDSVKLEWNASNKRYEGNHAEFMTSGKYSLFFYAKEKNTGIVSAPLEKLFYKAK